MLMIIIIAQAIDRIEWAAWRKDPVFSLPGINCKLVGRQRSAQQEALNLVATEGAENIKLDFAFNALSQNFEPQRVTQIDNDLGKNIAAAAIGNIADETTIDLQTLDREALQIGKR